MATPQKDSPLLGMDFSEIEKRVMAHMAEIPKFHSGGFVKGPTTGRFPRPIPFKEGTESFRRSASTCSKEQPGGPMTVAEMLEVRDTFRRNFPMPGLSGRVVVTENAMAYPKAAPHTDDMREYVERVGRTRVPATLRLGSTLFTHPTIYEKLKVRLK